MAGKKGAKSSVDGTRRKNAGDEDKLISGLKKENLALKDELRTRQEELEAQAEELEAQLEELRANNEELERQIEERRRAEDAIKKSRFILARSQEMAHLGNWAWNVQAGEMKWSDETYRIYGYTPGEARPDEGLAAARVHPGDKALFLEFIESVKRDGERRSIDYRIVKPDGAIRFVATLVDRVARDRAGNVERVYGITQDITERKRSEEWASRLAAIVTSSDAAIISKTLDGLITSWNRGAERLYGYSAVEVLGKHIDIIVPPDCQQELQDILGRIKHGERIEHHETVRVAKDGRRIDVSVTISPMFDTAGRLIGASTIARDITGQKQARDALQEKHEELEALAEELRSQTEELRSVNDELERQIEERKRAEEELRRSRDELNERVEERTSELLRINKELEARIRERNEAEEAVRLAYAYNRSLIEASLDPLVTIAPDGRITDVNTATEVATGYSRNALIGTDFSRYFTDPAKAREGYLKAFGAGSIKDYPLELKNKNGRITPVIYNASVYRDETGKVTGVFAAARDITEQKKAEEARLRLAAIVDSSDDAIVGITLDGTITSWNAGAKKLYGYSEDEVLGKSVSILATPDYPDKVPNILGKIRHGEHIEHYETIRKQKDGNAINVSLSVSPIKDSKGVITGASMIARDITGKKRAEEAIRLAGLYNRSLIEASLDPLVTISPDGRITDVNAATEKATGFSREHLIGTDFSGYFTDSIKAKEGYLTAFRYGSVTDYPLEIRHRDGHVTPVIYNASVYRDETGQVTGVFAAARDITERKRLEEALQKSYSDLEARVRERTAELQEKTAELEAQAAEMEMQAEELRANNEELEEQITERRRAEEALREMSDYLDSLVNYANAPIIVWDPGFVITRFNQAFERLTGYAAAEMVGSKLDKLFPPESREEALAKIKRTLAGEHWESVEIPIFRKDRGTRVVLWNSANIYRKDGDVLVATIAQGQDITERKRAEEELNVAKSQAELYLDLMGHDISNMHQIALSQLELAQEIIAEEGGLGGDDKELIDTPIETLMRSAKLIDNVRKLQKLRMGEYKTEAIDLGAMLSEVIEEDTNIPGAEVTINYTTANGCYVMANPLLKDVFVNLVGNAIKHSGGATTINIGLERLMLNGSLYYRVTIEDDGPGIPDEKKEEIFHRFKRGQTKARGVGLGLYIVKTLVDSFHGRVWVEDRVEGDYTQGSRFIVDLPSQEDEYGE